MGTARAAPGREGPLSVFISYRRDDAAGSAGRIHDTLVKRFGSGHVFMDVGDIEPGEDFVRVVTDILGRCTAVVVVIGRGWATATDDDGARRLEDPQDYVRAEVASALTSGAAVYPVLVDGARMPRPGDLPADLRPLATLNAIEISPTRYQYDVGRLVGAIRGLVPRRWWRRTGGRVALGVAGLAVGVAGILALWPSPGPAPGPGDRTSEAAPALVEARVNFQMPASQTPDGYLADFGEPFGPRTGPDQGDGLTYGWVHQGTHEPYDMVGKGRDRDTPGIEQRRDTLLHMQAGEPGSWEIAVPDGRYAVDVSVGDAAPTGVHAINVEGVPVISGFDGTTELFEENGTTVDVDDGVLTVDCVGGENTKINYVHVTQLPA